MYTSANNKAVINDSTNGSNDNDMRRPIDDTHAPHVHLQPAIPIPRIFGSTFKPSIKMSVIFAMWQAATRAWHRKRIWQGIRLASTACESRRQRIIEGIIVEHWKSDKGIQSASQASENRHVPSLRM
jgi:hypothetical protein